jgi:S1-C subfamily serine protease
MQQPPGEMVGIVIDAEGHALVLGAWARDAAPVFLRVTAPDGSESNARYVGAHPGRGLAVIKLDSNGVAPPLPVAEDAPEPGELLMCLNGNNGAVSWISSPGSSTKNGGDANRFPVAGGEGATYLFNTQGQLAALGFERFALPMNALDSDIKWIIANHKDIAPRQLGVKYAPVTPLLRRGVRLLGNRPAVVVQEVTPGSPAEKAGLKKNDIVVTIDRRPIWQIAQIQWDIATRTDSVPIGIIRDQKETSLDIPLAPVH